MSVLGICLPSSAAGVRVRFADDLSAPPLGPWPTGIPNPAPLTSPSQHHQHRHPTSPISHCCEYPRPSTNIPIPAPPTSPPYHKHPHPSTTNIPAPPPFPSKHHRHPHPSAMSILLQCAHSPLPSLAWLPPRVQAQGRIIYLRSAKH